jgi:hypothetical protein
MTDFFAELEGHLHAAARRRARRGPRIVAMAAAAAVAVALAFAGLAAIDRGDPEVAAPGPTPAPTTAGPCGAPPQAVLNQFAVLRRERQDFDQAADPLLERLAQDFPGVGRPDRVWPEAGRMARSVNGNQIWLFPVALRECAPGLCWVQVAGDSSVAYCHTLQEVLRPISLITSEGPDPFVIGLVPDGRRALGVDGEARVEGTTRGNVFFAEDATEVEEAGPEVRVGCHAPGVTDEAPPPELLDIVPGLRDGPLRLPSETWSKALADQRLVAYTRHARSYGTHAGMEIFGVAYSPLPPRCNLPGDPVEAGACLIAAPPRSEYFAGCFSGTRIAEGRALVHDLAAGLAYALVPAGTRRATLGGEAMRIEGDFAFLETRETADRMVIER